MAGNSLAFHGTPRRAFPTGQDPGITQGRPVYGRRLAPRNGVRDRAGCSGGPHFVRSALLGCESSLPEEPAGAPA